jgi:hypothetical protein
MGAKPEVSTAQFHQYGSQANGRYDVSMRVGEPGIVQSWPAYVNRSGGATVIVVYLGRLTGKTKTRGHRLSRDQGHSYALLDETLLVFLTGEEDSRFTAFLRVALAYTAATPYTPFQAAIVHQRCFSAGSHGA